MEIPEDKMDEMSKLAVDMIATYVQNITLIVHHKTTGEPKLLFTPQLTILMVETFTMLAAMLHSEDGRGEEEAITMAVKAVVDIGIRSSREAIREYDQYMKDNPLGEKMKFGDDPFQVVAEAIKKAQEFKDR